MVKSDWIQSSGAPGSKQTRHRCTGPQYLEWHGTSQAQRTQKRLAQGWSPHCTARWTKGPAGRAEVLKAWLSCHWAGLGGKMRCQDALSLEHSVGTCIKHGEKEEMGFQLRHTWALLSWNSSQVDLLQHLAMLSMAWAFLWVGEAGDTLKRLWNKQLCPYDQATSAPWTPACSVSVYEMVKPPNPPNPWCHHPTGSGCPQMGASHIVSLWIEELWWQLCSRHGIWRKKHL